MLCQELIGILQEQSPEYYACEWDNVGLLVGDPQKEIKRVYIALDATDEAVAEAVDASADLLLTHHPMIFRAVKRITAGDFIGRKIIKLIRNDISYYAMHTNYDVVTMGEQAAEMLRLRDTEIMEVTYDDGSRQEGLGRTGELPGEMSLAECGRYVKQVFGLDTVRLFGNPEQKVSRAAVLPGSGKSLVDAALRTGADVMISGDFGHHDGIDAVMRGLTVIDAGHYGIEKIFVSQMAGYIRETFTGLTVYTEKDENPFWVV